MGSCTEANRKVAHVGRESGGLLGAALAAILTLLTPSRASFAADQPAPCAAPAYHQFDFWIGDWDVFDIANPAKQVARVHVDSILNGCVLREDYKATDGHAGESFSIFDATRQVWHQTWVTDHGRLLMIEGGKQDRAIILEGADRTSDGRERRVRGIWKSAADGVHERALTSLDGGKSWTQWFDLVFRAHQK